VTHEVGIVRASDCAARMLDSTYSCTVLYLLVYCASYARRLKKLSLLVKQLLNDQVLMSLFLGHLIYKLISQSCEKLLSTDTTLSLPSVESEYSHLSLDERFCKPPSLTIPFTQHCYPPCFPLQNPTMRVCILTPLLKIASP
jgi:hypothetical protein